MAHLVGRHSSRSPDRRSAADPGARRLERPRRRRAFGGRAEARDVRDAGGARAPAAPRAAALSYGRGVPLGPRGGGGARDGPVRLRRADPQRPQRHRLHARRPGEHPQRRLPRGRAAARRNLRLRGLHHVLPRLPAAPVPGGGAVGPAALVAAQRPLPDPARGRNARRDPRGELRPVGRFMAPPLPSTGTRMTTLGLFALSFAPSGQNTGGGLAVFVLQIGAFIAIFYFLLIRPQRRQQAEHKQLLASLQRGDQIVTSGGIIGEVVHIKDDQVTVRSGESKLLVSRGPETEAAEEGCLSIPEIFGEVERPQTVELEALDREGRPYRATLSGFKARAAQHEIDHLDGVLFLDHLSAVKRGLLLAKWKKSRKGKPGYLKEVVPEPAPYGGTGPAGEL